MQILAQYKPIFTFTGRYVFLLGGAGTGKSFVIAQRIISDLLTNNNYNWLCVRKYHIDVFKSVFNQIKDVIWKFGLQSYFKFSGRHLIECKLNNSKVQFVGLNDEYKIKSIAEITHVFVEEADEIEVDYFDVLDTRARSNNASSNQVFLAFNPPEKNHWIATRFFKSGEVLPEYNVPYYWSEFVDNVELRHLALRTHYKDNPKLPDDSKAKYEQFKEYNYSYYERYCLGTWTTNAGGTFFAPQYTNYGSVSGRNLIYIDPAWSQQINTNNDYTCILKTSFIDNKFHINSCVLQRAMTPNEMMSSVYAMVDKHTQGIYYDAKRGQQNHMNALRANARIQLPLKEDYTDVDKSIPEAMTEWINSNIVLPDNFASTATGQEFLKQVYNFEGKGVKSKYHDDAPDALICSVHLINKVIRKNSYLKGWI